MTGRPAHGLGQTVRPWFGRAGGVLFVVLVLAWFALLRPPLVGGTTNYVIVVGDSMVPTYASGDLVVTRPAAAYPTGAIVLYRVPASEPGAGALIIHRVVGGDPSGGFTTRGDHNPGVDRWHPRASDVLGTSIAVIPKVGLAMTLVRQPILGATNAAVFALVVMWPRRRLLPTRAWEVPRCP